MRLLDRWTMAWKKAKDHAGWKYAYLMFKDHHLPAPPDEDDEPEPPKWLVKATLRFSLFAERMEALGHVLQQLAPEDINSHNFHLEPVGRAVYTAKAIVALALDLRTKHEHGVRDDICVAMYNLEKCAAEESYEKWDEIVVPPGLRDWHFDIRSDTSA